MKKHLICQQNGYSCISYCNREFPAKKYYHYYSDGRPMPIDTINADPWADNETPDSKICKICLKWKYDNHSIKLHFSHRS